MKKDKPYIFTVKNDPTIVGARLKNRKIVIKDIGDSVENGYHISFYNISKDEHAKSCRSIHIRGLLRITEISISEEGLEALFRAYIQMQSIKAIKELEIKKSNDGKDS